jgi:hypothetical protein
MASLRRRVHRAGPDTRRRRDLAGLECPSTRGEHWLTRAPWHVPRARLHALPRRRPRRYRVHTTTRPQRSEPSRPAERPQHPGQERKHSALISFDKCSQGGWIARAATHEHTRLELLVRAALRSGHPGHHPFVSRPRDSKFPQRSLKKCTAVGVAFGVLGASRISARAPILEARLGAHSSPGSTPRL